MQKQTAVIKIRTADIAELAVGNHHFRMIKAGCIFINTHARRNQLAKIGASCHLDQLFIGKIWNNNADIHATACGKNQGIQKRFIGHKIGRTNIERFLCILNKGQKNIAAAGLFIMRRFGKRQDIGIRLRKRLVKRRHIGIPRLVLLHRHIPKRKKHDGKFCGGRALCPHHRVLPIPEPTAHIHIFIGNIGTARMGDAPVNHGNFSMVAIVLDGGNEGTEAIENTDLDS